MNATELKALQAPLKQQYKDTPETAIITLKANGRIGEGVTCSVDTCLLYTSPSPRDATLSRMPSSA